MYVCVFNYDLKYKSNVVKKDRIPWFEVELFFFKIDFQCSESESFRMHTGWKSAGAVEEGFEDLNLYLILILVLTFPKHGIS